MVPSFLRIAFEKEGPTIVRFLKGEKTTFP
jgi:hypothetical protein